MLERGTCHPPDWRCAGPPTVRWRAGSALHAGRVTTTTAPAFHSRTTSPDLLGGRLVVPLAAVVVVLLRLPLVGRPLRPDEAGFLTVAAQWHPGTSLYGDYWVDRPPLLLALHQLAAALGGAVALRLLGIVAAAVAVLAVGWTARRLAGGRAGGIAALATAAWLVSPLAGAVEVDGEPSQRRSWPSASPVSSAR